MKRKKIIVYGYLISFGLALISCTKFVTVDPPITQLVTSSVFETDQTAISAMNGIYSMMLTGGGFASGGNGSIGFLCGLSADELTNYLPSPNVIQFYQNSLDKNNPELNTYLWLLPYQCIYQTNGVLEGVSASTTISASVKKELLGEAKFVRAFCNFYLTNLYGEIPLITNTDYQSNATAARSSREIVYQQIITDLIDAQDDLAIDYSYSNGERVRPNRWAATALLARVYLYIQDWNNAEIQASKVIDNSELFELLPDLNAVFLKNSRETIWQLMPNVPGLNTGEGYIYIPTISIEYAVLTNELVNAFEAGDQRKVNWVADTTFDTTTYYYPFKYKIKTGEELLEYSMVLRLAEQYLIRAEARAMQNNISAAQDDLDAIRNRAGLPNTTAADQSELLSAISQEHRVELFTEWGDRWLNLIRTGQSNDVLAPIKPAWQSTDILYPIPQTDIQRNENLTQNPGY